MSVDLEHQIVVAGKVPLELVKVDPWVGAVCLNVGEIRGADMLVGYQPLPANEFHGAVWQIDERRKRRLHKMAQWFVPVDGVALK